MKIVENPEVASPASTADKLLTPPEAQQLARCERIIENGLETFREVGEALLQVRDQRLYRSEHNSFATYCRIKWKITSRQANRLIGASEVVENLKRDQLVSVLPVAFPENEAQARPLTALTPPQQIEAARIAAAKAEKPTTKQFEEAAEEVKPRVTVAGKSSTTTTTGKPSLESLIELIDEAQTMVRASRPKEAILEKLKRAADLATRINNAAH
jgi:hypothetical protein